MSKATTEGRHFVPGITGFKAGIWQPFRLVTHFGGWPFFATLTLRIRALRIKYRQVHHAHRMTIGLPTLNTKMNDDNFSLTSLFPSATPPSEDHFILYDPLTLSLPSTEGKAITLLANQFFNPAIVLAEQIDIGIISVAGKSSNARYERS